MKILPRAQSREAERAHVSLLVALEHVLLLVLVLLLSFPPCPGPQRLVYRLYGDLVQAQTTRGALLWQRRLPQPHPGYALSLSTRQRFPGALLVEGNTLYVAAANLYALRADNGVVLWARGVPYVTAFFTAYQVADALWWWQGTLYVETMDNRLLAFSPDHGEELWEQLVDDSSISSPVIAFGTVFIVALLPLDPQAALYTVEAIEMQDGVVRWVRTFQADETGALPPLAPMLNAKKGTLRAHLGDLLVLLQSRDGKLLVIWRRIAFLRRSW